MARDFQFGLVDAGGVQLHLATIGDPSAPLVVCLHGFPEYWAAWADVMRELADEFYLVAPDQRGFNLSSKPEGVDSYRTGRMVADLHALVEYLSPERPFVLAGHDWGASVAYAYAMTHPQRLSKLIVANGVHPICFQRAIIEDDEQRQASQYINRLRAADAEELMSEDGYRRLMRMIEGFSETAFMTDEKRAEYVEAWSHEGALTGMLNWYRASPIVVPEPGEDVPTPPILSMPQENFAICMPHLVIWGEADQALRPSCLEGLGGFAPDLQITPIADAGHWLLHEKPGEVAAAMRDFIAG